MRALIFSQYYPPEVGATQTRVHYFARHLAESGHDVTVVAELPNHPAGVIFDGYRGRLYDRRQEDGIDTVRVWVHASAKKSFWRRISFYATYASSATLAALLVMRKPPDVIFASSPPLPVLVCANLVGRIWRRPYVADIRDIWPAIGVALGELRGHRVIEAAQLLERKLYREAALVTAVTQGFCEHIVAAGTAPDGVRYLPNGTIPELFTPEKADTDLRKRLGLERHFVLGFLGNHGIAQGLDVLVEAASLLTDRPDITILCVGEGPVKAELVAKAAEQQLHNIVFHPQVPLDEVVSYINACDLLAVPLRDLPILRTFIPSKMFDFMACARPVVLLAEGEARDVLEASGGGFAVPPGDSKALAELMRCLADDPQRLGDIGRRGRAYVLANRSRGKQADHLGAMLAKVAAS